MKYLLAIMLLVSCKKHAQVDPREKNETIASKAELYKSLHKGWAHDKCDSLGFTALCKLSGGCAEANVFDAEGEPGRWYRSPEKDCLDKGESRSDISKDMFVMLFPYLWNAHDKDAMVRIQAYGRANNWMMGRHDGSLDGLSSVFMVPGLSLFLGEMISGVRTDQSDIPVNSGFAAHLDVIFWITQAMVRGEITTLNYERLRVMTERQPRNALFQAAYHRFKDGDMTKAIAILLDEGLFPSDRLPTQSDRCEEYLWQRDDKPKDWDPCLGEKVHDGVDFLFAARVAGQL